MSVYIEVGSNIPKEALPPGIDVDVNHMVNREGGWVKASSNFGAESPKTGLRECIRITSREATPQK
ncbi:unnamed protein product [Callosobruchus maculatus]|uniref:Uncharacterized protein n=1 Tax=Callosobruchus maculatus TaxID=64391 RepID=A0A653D4I7_CALMS|nr:unnamed protein product [Callosobruchus maculatus]